MTELQVEITRNTKGFLSYVFKFNASSKKDLDNARDAISHMDTIIEELITVRIANHRKKKIALDFASKHSKKIAEIVAP